MKRFLTIALVAGFLALVGAPEAWAQPTGDVIIQNGTVLTVTNGTLNNTDVLIQDGKITRIGAGLRVPDGTTTIDATGLYVMPGIIDAHSHAGLSSVNEGSAPITSEVSMEDVIDPYSIGLYRALAGGVTTSHAMHGSANAIGGQCETIKHRYGVTHPDGMKMIDAPRTIKFALGENPTRNHGQGSGINPSSRMGVEMVIREGFARAKRYMEAWDRYEEARLTDLRAIPPEYNGRLEVLADILRGDIIVQCHSYRADEILMLLDVG